MTKNIISKRGLFVSITGAAMLAMLALLTLAPTAQAQNFFSPEGDCPEGFVAQGDFCVTPEVAQALEDDPFTCEGIPTTEEFVACLNAVQAELDAQQNPAAQEGPAQEDTAPVAQMTPEEASPGIAEGDALPRSGGPVILLPVGALMIAAGVGLGLMGRRQ